MFQHFGLKLPMSGLILTIFGENQGKNWRGVGGWTPLESSQPPLQTQDKKS